MLRVRGSSGSAEFLAEGKKVTERICSILSLQEAKFFFILKELKVFSFFWVFLGPHLRHMEVPRLVVQSEL